MEHAVNKVKNRRLFGYAKWKYFCGICWSMIRENQDIARSLLDAEGTE